MIRSMTGYAHKTITLSHEQEKSQIVITIKSLNSRYFEATFKIAYPLSAFETELTKRIKDTLIRGHVYVTIHMSNQQLFKGAIEPAMGTIEKYLNALKNIQKTFHIEGTISMQSIVDMPNIFNTEERQIDDENKALLLKAVDETLFALIQEQEKEGDALLLDFNKRLAIIKTELEAIALQAEKLLVAQKEKVALSLQEFINDESKLADAKKNALYALLDKIDIHEEITRFKSHLVNIGSIMKSADIEKGKRLDFTLQELSREINTMSAKCSDAGISSHAVNIKVELEKIREQAQNIV